MAKRKYTDAKAAANKRYDDKTYKRYTLYLRVEDDKEIIEDIEKAKREGLSLREWLSNIWKE